MTLTKMIGINAYPFHSVQSLEGLSIHTDPKHRPRQTEDSIMGNKSWEDDRDGSMSKEVTTS